MRNETGSAPHAVQRSIVDRSIAAMKNTLQRAIVSGFSVRILAISLLKTDSPALRHANPRFSSRPKSQVASFVRIGNGLSGLKREEYAVQARGGREWAARYKCMMGTNIRPEWDNKGTGIPDCGSRFVVPGLRL